MSNDKRLNVAWAVLVAITVGYVLVDRTAEHGGHRAASTAATVAAIGLGLVKYRIIVRELMDVRHAPRVLRRLTDALIATMAVALLATYLVGRAIA